MKHLRETFTDQEMGWLKDRKNKSKRNWHDFILEASRQWEFNYLDGTATVPED